MKYVVYERGSVKRVKRVKHQLGIIGYIGIPACPLTFNPQQVVRGDPKLGGEHALVELEGLLLQLQCPPKPSLTRQ